MNPVIARMIAAVGVVLALVSIWTPVLKSGFGENPTYWNIPGHGLGIAFLVLAILAAVGILMAFMLESPIFDRLWLLAGTTAGGLFLFYPIGVTSEDSASDLRIAGWLGVAAFILFVTAGALVSLSPQSAPYAAAMSVPAAPETAAPVAPEMTPTAPERTTPAAPEMAPPAVEPSESPADEPEAGA
jgi:hypothetical protein